MLMSPSYWLLALVLFTAGVFIVRRIKPEFIWRDVAYPISEIRSSKSFDDPASPVEVSYVEKGEQRTARMTAAEFKELVTKDPKTGKHFFHGKGPDIAIAGTCLLIGAAVSVAASWAFSSST